MKVREIMDENETTVTENMALANKLAATAVDLFMTYDPIVSSESWVGWSDVERLALRNAMFSLAKVTTAVRSAFDEPIWNKRVTGIEPIRAKSSRETTAPKTTEGKLAALLK